MKSINLVLLQKKLKQKKNVITWIFFNVKKHFLFLFVVDLASDAF